VDLLPAALFLQHVRIVTAGSNAIKAWYFYFTMVSGFLFICFIIIINPAVRRGQAGVSIAAGYGLVDEVIHALPVLNNILVSWILNSKLNS